MITDDLTGVKDDMVAFIAGHGMGRMKAYVPEDVPSIVFEDEDADGWKDFVEHAKSANAPFITMSEVVLEPEDVATLIGQVHTHPAERERLTVLAPVVASIASDDAEAQRILLRAAGHLAELADGARRGLARPAAPTLPAAGVGGVFSAPLIWDHFAHLTGAARPLAPASVGAALLARQLLTSQLPNGPVQARA